MTNGTNTSISQHQKTIKASKSLVEVSPVSVAAVAQCIGRRLLSPAAQLGTNVPRGLERFTAQSCTDAMHSPRVQGQCISQTSLSKILERSVFFS
eukprot:4396415-Amphidinium_carterae.1